MKPDPKYLKVYKASAGSGKTYTLTAEYLRILFQEEIPFGYKRIIAVTFTNKATAEMKGRILSELNKMSIGEGGALLQQLVASTGKSEEELRAISGELLRRILEDYSSFKIQTIDSFFQEVVRSFAVELNQNSAFGIELDQKNVVTLSVESLINRLGEKGKAMAAFRSWVDDLYRESITEERSTNPFSEIKKLALNLLFSEQSSKQLEQLSSLTTGQLQQAKQKLRERHKELIKELWDEVEPLTSFLADTAIDLSKSYRGSLELFAQLTDEEACGKLLQSGKPFTATVRSIANGEGALCAKGLGEPQKSLYDELGDQLRALIGSVVSTYDRLLLDYNTIALIVENLNVIPGLIELRNDIERYRQENNCLIISDINTLLSTIIGDSEIPFVYEKMGTRIHHYMIDEFQDTSPLQWHNFLPLLQETLSTGHDSLIVGDVKQSIYRFRGTDSSLLGSKISEDLGPHIVDLPLNRNWRSERNVVEFNNAFFDQLADFKGTYAPTHAHLDLSSAEVDNAYTEVRQEMPMAKTDTAGYVRLTGHSNTQCSNLEFLIESDLEPLLIRLQQEQGYRPRDIAFLVRTRDEGAAVAQFLSYLTQRHRGVEGVSFSFLSDEALLVGNSLVVRLLTSLAFCLTAPGKPDFRNELEQHLYRYLNLHGAMRELQSETPLTVDALLSLSLIGVSVYEVLSRAVQLISYVPTAEEIYVNAYFDLVFKFSAQRSATFATFVEWWGQQEPNAMISMGEAETDGIVISTIHKSKGLEYPVVVMPFASWPITNKMMASPFLLPSTTLPAFYRDLLPFYIVSSSFSKLEMSHFAPIVVQKYADDYADTLNLLYVAFTRATRELYVYYEKPASRPSSPKASTLLIDRIASSELRALLTEEEDPEISATHYSYGQPMYGGVKEKEKSATSHITLHGLSATPRYADLVLSDRHSHYTYAGGEMRRKGVLLHDLMARTRNTHDFARECAKAVRRGKLTVEESARYQSLFAQALRHPVISTWFAPEATVLRELPILSEGNAYRPDAVVLQDGAATVVDYKFGEKHQEKYRQQVQTYLTLLQRMGYAPVQGYLWYGLGSDLVPITPPTP